MTRLPLALAAAFVSLSCGGRASSSAPKTEPLLCDGTKQLRLQFVTLADPAHAGTSAMLMRNGAVYMRVDGTCRYWVYGVGLSDSGAGRTATQLDPILSGELSPAEAKELSIDLQYQDWQSFHDIHSELTTSGLTASVFTDGVHEFSCGRECDGEGMPKEARTLRAIAMGWVQRLTDKGRGVGGAVRVGSYDASLSSAKWQATGYACATPPTSLQPASFQLTTTESVIVGTEVTLDAESLRQFRDRYRADRFSTPLPAGTPPWSVNLAIPICDMGRVWSVIISDVIEPYEQDGIVPR